VIFRKQYLALGFASVLDLDLAAEATTGRHLDLRVGRFDG